MSEHELSCLIYICTCVPKQLTVEELRELSIINTEVLDEDD